MAFTEQFMAELAAPEKVTTVKQLSKLSDLSSGEAQTFAREWRALGVRRRRQIMEGLIKLAQDHVEMNFDWFFLLCLEDTDETIRARSIEGLWECHDPRLVEPLIARLRQDPSSSVRAAAAVALGVFALLAELGEVRPRYGEQVQAALLQTLGDREESLDIRCHALESLAYFSQPSIIEAIEQAYNSREPAMNLSALRAMGRNLDPRWLPILLPELSSPDVARRYEATVACGEMGDEKAVPALVDLLTDEDSKIQMAAIRSLGQIGGERARKVLSQLIQHRQAMVREAAQEALAEAQFLADHMSMPF